MELMNDEYTRWLEEIKQKIKKAHIKAAVNVNIQLIELYWELAAEILQKQEKAHWGDSILEQLSIDLRLSFPHINGFSRRNLYAIRQWYLFYNQKFEFVPQLVAQIPWGHNRLIISKVKDVEVALFYTKATLENGWNRANLEFAIKNNYANYPQ